MSNTVKIELSVPELATLTAAVNALAEKVGIGAIKEAAAQIPANPTPAGVPSVNSPLTANAPATAAPATPAPTFPASANPAPAAPFTVPAPATNAPLPPNAASNAYSSTPSQAYPSNPHQNILPPMPTPQPTFPPQIQQPVPQPQQPPVTTGVTYTMEQLAAAGGPIMNRGDGPKLVAALAKYGVQALTMLKPEQYASFAADLRALGAQI